MRLIDADALKEQFKETHQFCIFAFGGDFSKMPIWYKAACDELVNCIAEVVNAPTIDAVHRWIPCEERLPEEEGGYLATMKDGSVQECGYIPTKYSDVMHTGWSTCEANGFKFLHELDVIAWMPLPEPYDGERKDDE